MLDLRWREFIALIAGGGPLLAVELRRARGQQPAQVRRIGVLMPFAEDRNEVGRKLSQKCLDRSSTVRNLRIVLPIIIAEQTIENGGIAINENALDPGKDKLLVGVGIIFCRRDGGCLHACALLLLQFILLPALDRLLGKRCLM
jgi:hypothetical protein